MTKHTKRYLALAAAAALLGVLAGCSSDATAPQDQIPPPSAKDAAAQAGMVAFGVAQFGTRLMDPSSPAKAVQTITWNGQLGLEGSVYIDYRFGAEGDSAPSNEATWAHLSTEDGAPVVYTVPGLGGQTTFALDIRADLDQQADQATILEGSGGTMVSGEYTVSFTMAGVIVGSAGFPQQGGMTITSGDHTADVTFNGSNMVTMIVDHVTTYFINLATGEVTTGVPV